MGRGEDSADMCTQVHRGFSSNGRQWHRWLKIMECRTESKIRDQWTGTAGGYPRKSVKQLSGCCPSCDFIPCNKPADLSQLQGLWPFEPGSHPDSLEVVRMKPEADLRGRRPPRPVGTCQSVSETPSKFPWSHLVIT